RAEVAGLPGRAGGRRAEHRGDGGFDRLVVGQVGLRLRLRGRQAAAREQAGGDEAGGGGGAGHQGVSQKNFVSPRPESSRRALLPALPSQTRVAANRGLRGQWYSYPTWNVIRPSGGRAMLVMYTGSPPGPSCERLDGVVYGVNASLAGLGNGTKFRN